MQVKVLIEGNYIITATMDGDGCPVEQSLLDYDPAYEGYVSGLLDMMARTAASGLQQFSSAQVHYIHAEPKIYEYVRGRLRLIFFHGEGNTIVVCTEVIVKKTQKADTKVVNRAIRARDDYFLAIRNRNLVLIRDDENEDE